MTDRGDGRPLLRPEAQVVEALRDNASRLAAVQAEQLRLVAELADHVRAEYRRAPWGQRAPFDPDDEAVEAGLIRDEIVATLGTAAWLADRLASTAHRAVHVVPAAVAALGDGRLDADRLHALVEGLAHTSDDTAVEVTDRLLNTLDKQGVSAPWDGPTCRAWKERITRAVTRADADAARRRRTAAIKARCVRAWPNGDGTGTVQITAADADIIDAHTTLRDLAEQRPKVGPDGKPVTIDQRMADAFTDLLRRIAAGEPLPATTRRRERDLGLILHTDTLFGDGPAADEPGELRGLGATATLDATTARHLAADQLTTGKAITVMLVDDTGLQRLVRLATPPAGGSPGGTLGGWTRQSLLAAVRAALPDLPPLEVAGYVPSTAITDHVRAARPRCSAPGCRRTARHCDLDHDTEWPRGPTSVTNLDPKCRRHHGYKTHHLWRSHLHPDGSVTWTTLLGTTVTTRHEPLPGCALA